MMKRLVAMGVRTWPFAQLKAARRFAEVRCKDLSSRAAFAHVRPVVMDALVLGHTKRYRLGHP